MAEQVTTANVRDGQFSLGFVLYLLTFAAVLLAVLSQRSAVGVFVWSLVGIACALRLRQTYLRRSLVCLFLGTGMLAVAAIYWFGWPLPSLAFALLGGNLLFAGLFATIVNAFDARHAGTAGGQGRAGLL